MSPNKRASISNNSTAVRQEEIATALAMRADRVLKFSEPEDEKFHAGEFYLLRRGASALGSKFCSRI